MSELWKELHKRAFLNKGEDDSEYLRSFAFRIPSYNACKCRDFWNIWIRNNPPLYGPNGEYFEWTVKTHSAVNAKLGKPNFSLEEAKKIYS